MKTSKISGIQVRTSSDEVNADKSESTFVFELDGKWYRLNYEHIESRSGKKVHSDRHDFEMEECESPIQSLPLPVRQFITKRFLEEGKTDGLFKKLRKGSKPVGSEKYGWVR